MKLAEFKKKVKNNSIIFSNFSYLMLLQAFSIIIPLITYPYLLRVLGFDLYGTIIFAQTIAVNIGIIINFGFNISGTKEIACNRNDLNKLSKIVSSVYSIKAILWLFCFLIYFILLYTIPIFQNNKLLFFISFFLTFNELLFPTWFFQGIEKMKYASIINVSIRSIFIIVIFIYVKDKSDYLIVPILNALGSIIGGFIALYVVFVKEKIRFIIQPINTLRYFFLESLPLFISTLSVQIYVNVNKILIGSFLGMTEVAIYDLGEKITNLIKIPVSMISQATFPKISREKNIKFINSVMFVTVIIISIVYLIIFICSDWIIKILSGDFNIQAVVVLRILAFSAIFSAFNLFLGGNRLVPLGYKRFYVINAILTSLYFMVAFTLLWLIGAINVYSVTILYLTTEIFVFVLNSYRSYRLNILFSNHSTHDYIKKIQKPF